MASTSYQNPILNDVENIMADASTSFNLLPVPGLNPSILSSFLRCAPLFTHTVHPTRGVDPSTFEGKSESRFESGSESKSEQMLDDEERTRVANIMEAGFQLLLSGEANCNPLDHSLLGLKVIMDIEHEQIQGDFEEYLAVVIPRKELPTYEFKPEEAVGLLLDYTGFWMHTCSIVLADDELSTLRDRILTSNLRGKADAEDNQSSSDYAEVVLYVLIDGQIDDKGISNSEQLMKFLSELNEERMLKVHITCSSATMKEEINPTYSHLVIRTFEEGGGTLARDS